MSTENVHQDVEGNVEESTAVSVEENVEVNVEATVEENVEAHAEAHVEPHVEAHVEPHVEAHAEAHVEPHVEPHVEEEVEVKIEEPLAEAIGEKEHVEDIPPEPISTPIEQVTVVEEEAKSEMVVVVAKEDIPTEREYTGSMTEISPEEIAEEVIAETTEKDAEEGSTDSFPHPADDVASLQQDELRGSIKSVMSKIVSETGEDDEGEDFLGFVDDNRESMLTQAGSYKSSSTSSSEAVTEEDETLPKNFQDYVKRYSALFSKIAGSEEVPCDEEAGKTFLKIDLNEIVSGYKTEEKLCRDVRSALAGMTRARQDLICIENESIVLRKGYEQFKGVRILSGGHMGNEPLYIDYIGKGLITGAVLGTVNDPPSVACVTKAMRELSKGAPGILVIIQNNVEYRLVFGLAMERIRMEGFLDIDMVTVGDDCFERCKSPVGRRGLVGIVLLLKLAGAMATCLKPLREIYIAVRAASKSIVTISCMTKPFKAIGTGLDKNSKDGIHFNGDNCQMIKKMIDFCIHPLKYFSMRLQPEDSVIVLINSYRSKTPEFYIIVNLVAKELEKRNVRIERFYADNFLTGFWPGFSITLLLDCNSRRSEYMDAPCNCTLWPRLPSKGDLITKVLETQALRGFGEMGPMLPKTEMRQVKNAIFTACKAIILCENVLNTMHFFGNYGTKLRKGADAIMQAIRMSSLNFNRPFNLLIEISEILVESLPGVMGAMYGCLFEGAARSFLRSPLTTISAQNWSEAMDEALKTLRAYTNAKGGIVSLALSLIPVVSAIHGPYIRLPQKANRNPILSALESLRYDIEERIKQTADEKESLLKNQLDVESYALIIWLHAIYSSVYWKVPSDTSIASPSSTAAEEEAMSRRSVSSKSSRSQSARIPSVKGINKSLEFIPSSERINRVSHSSAPRSRGPSQQSQTKERRLSGKIFT